jgi:hypothetical protein
MPASTWPQTSALPKAMACSDRLKCSVGDPGAGHFARLRIMEHLMRRLQLVRMGFVGMVVVVMFVVIVVVTLGHDFLSSLFSALSSPGSSRGPIVQDDGCPITGWMGVE